MNERAIVATYSSARYYDDGGRQFLYGIASKDPEAAKDAKTIKDIVRYAPESGQRDIIVAAESLIPPGQPKPLPIEDYAWSDDASKVLLCTNTKRVWRKETRGDYWVFDRQTRELKKLGGEAAPATLMFATFSPDGKRVAYVCQNNLFVQSLDNLGIKQLTTDGSATTINGTADWVYEEEFGLRNGLRCILKTNPGSHRIGRHRLTKSIPCSSIACRMWRALRNPPTEITGILVCCLARRA